MKVSILVLNYNGKYLLEKFMESVVNAAKNSKHECRVILVDNVSSDGSVEFIERAFPDVLIYRAKENKILFSYNDAVKAINAEIVIFLNNDIRVAVDFIDYLVENFSDEKVFFAAPKILNFENAYNGGKSHFESKLGIIKSVTEKYAPDAAGSTQFISCGAFRGKTFTDLGGFDELYLPGIWEDADICYRGLKSGFKGVYVPKSVIWHDESSTFKKIYGDRKKMIIAHRNMFLFFWKNIDDPGIWILHIAMIIPLIMAALLMNKSEFAVGFVKALPRFWTAFTRRFNMVKERRSYVFKDGDLIQWSYR